MSLFFTPNKIIKYHDKFYRKFYRKTDGVILYSMEPIMVPGVRADFSSYIIGLYISWVN